MQQLLPRSRGLAESGIGNIRESYFKGYAKLPVPKCIITLRGGCGVSDRFGKHVQKEQRGILPVWKSIQNRKYGVESIS